jgi:DNA-binding PadR family transcriptional regulator
MKVLDHNHKSYLPQPAHVWNIMMVLGEGDAKHGYAINKRVEAEVGRRFSPATLYRTLRDMLQQGLIVEVIAPPDETDQRRRYYRVTGLARKVVRAEMDRVRRAETKPAYRSGLTLGKRSEKQ